MLLKLNYKNALKLKVHSLFQKLNIFSVKKFETLKHKIGVDNQLSFKASMNR